MRNQEIVETESEWQDREKARVWHLVHPTFPQTVFCTVNYWIYEDWAHKKELTNLKEITCPLCKELIKIIRTGVKTKKLWSR